VTRGAPQSVLAAVLAYYSIQIGSLLIFGPVRLTQVLVSFLITATQLSLFLWPSHVLKLVSDAGQGGTVPPSASSLLRHWLLFYAGFAFAAALASADAALSRMRHRVGTNMRYYLAAQRRDRIAATASGTIALLFWALSYKYLAFSLVAGISVTIIASVVGLVSQARVAVTLHAALSGR
jgi:hypothetical protein